MLSDVHKNLLMAGMEISFWGQSSKCAERAVSHTKTPSSLSRVRIHFKV
jgi:hypothetical protein